MAGLDNEKAALQQSRRGRAMTSALFVRSGSREKIRSLRGLIDNLKEPPLLSCVEPASQIPKDGALGPPPGFESLVEGVPNTSGPTPSEVRLFWSEAVAHFVVGSQGLRWVAFATDEEHLPAIETSLPTVPITGLLERSRKVIWRQRRDLARFLGKPDASGPDPLNLDVQLREFWQGPRLVAWWLVPAKGS
jgi:hypothetical protein